MPIFYGRNGETKVTMGYGDIVVSVCSSNGGERGALLFGTTAENAIGAAVVSPSSDGDPVWLVFDQVSSIEVVIKGLEYIRKIMLDKRLGRPGAAADMAAGTSAPLPKGDV